jgi:hypothetical protein
MPSNCLPPPLSVAAPALDLSVAAPVPLCCHAVAAPAPQRYAALLAPPLLSCWRRRCTAALRCPAVAAAQLDLSVAAAAVLLALPRHRCAIRLSPPLHRCATLPCWRRRCTAVLSCCRRPCTAALRCPAVTAALRCPAGAAAAVLLAPPLHRCATLPCWRRRCCPAGAAAVLSCCRRPCTAALRCPAGATLHRCTSLEHIAMPLHGPLCLSGGRGGRLRVITWRAHGCRG